MYGDLGNDTFGDDDVLDAVSADGLRFEIVIVDTNHSLSAADFGAGDILFA